MPTACGRYLPERKTIQMQHITYDAVNAHLSWPDAIQALKEGHKAPKPELDDMFLGPSDATLLNRGAYIEGLGYGAKAVTVFGANARRGLPTVQGAMFFFAPEDGQLRAIIESRLVTEWKTAADSVLGARLLARPDAKRLLIVGAGTVAASLVRAYSAGFSGLDSILVWARRGEQAEALVAKMQTEGFGVEAVPDLQAAAGQADIISTATMARAPVLLGDWIAPGTHVDLIGAFKADMREADDALMRKASVFVDNRDTTLHHIGELIMPLASGALAESDVLGDFYDLVGGAPGRTNSDQITVFKNGGGAHLDLMMARYIASVA
ncbi:ornithine cyclodeaminase [Primorskyibacter flagellatus]|uniref:Ornithine cyclodeaminase n=2 Tax=Primorskyibacter flagellatus TaxID=1387277 RepID=A0A1W2D4J5_9RHOB|nr:ornithine cyclodeaminase [Primorskyibacter flagellatus]